MDGVASANLLTDALALANWQNALVGAVITAFVTVIVKLTSIFFTACYDYVRFNFIPSSYEYEVDLAARNPRVFELADFKCLIVRYGTGSFLRHMASPEEKKDGRLQLKILEVPVKKEGDRMTLRLSIPVHKRIGTQFKCFANVKQPGQMNELLEI